MSYQIKTPKSLDEAVQLLGDGAACLAGGSNLLVHAHRGGTMPATLVDITLLHQLVGIQEQDGYLKIGSLTTFAQIEDSDLARRHFPCLHQAAAQVGGPQIRNVATLGGNLCDASPAADGSAALMALDAQVELLSTKGSRRMPLSDFFIHVGMTARRQDEILTSIYIPMSRAGFSAFHKVGTRNALAISVASMAVYLRIHRGAVAQVAIAAGAVAPVVKRAAKTEEYLEGKPLSAAHIRRAREILLTEVSPINDLRGTADYRRMICGNMLENLLGMGGQANDQD